MKLRATVLILCFTLLLGHIYGQIPRAQIVFAFAGIKTQNAGLDAAQIRVLESRISSNLLSVAQQEKYSIVIPNNKEEILQRFELGQNARSSIQQLELAEQLSARGFIIGEINEIAGTYYLDLHIYSIRNGELLLAQPKEYTNFEAMISDVPGTVFGLFGLDPSQSEAQGIAEGIANQSSNQNNRNQPTMEMIAGNWIGDTGLGTITIRPDGTASAILSEEDNMDLRVSIDGPLIKVRQDEPNAPKMYLPIFPYSISVQIAELARPMSWEFQLNADGSLLIGRKNTSYFYIERGLVDRVDNTYSREAVWTREE